ncbi:MAG: tetratricopeptide repeat protein [Elusimicrobiaceae bacterium]|nr:tetratricopeptide repeat protein [Elusimicrobiaceae bacterium]
MTNTTTKTEQDALTLFVSKLIDYCKTHAKLVGGVILLIAVVWTSTALYLNHQEKVRQDSWAQYYAVQTALLTQGQEQANAAAQSLAATYPDSDAAYYAQLLLADLLFSQENFAQATETYQKLLQAKNPHVRTIAAVSLASAQQATQNYAASIKTAQDFIAANPTSFALPQAYFTLAMSQELSGNKTAALDTYKKILEDYTKTYFGVFAKDKITALSK